MWSLKDLESTNLDDFPEKAGDNSNFEDCLNQCSFLGEGLSRKSDHHELESFHKMKKQDHQKNILLFDPDMNLGVDKGSQEVSCRWR